jgi:ABC-type transport system involved in multi-copper enzyme maturation permease subunit
MRLTLNHPQLVKELRPLVLPWIGAVATGSLLAIRPLVQGEGLDGLFMGIAVYGFFGGLAFLTALSFGSEFHERTLPLLLSQPQTRFHLWNQKMLIAAVAVLAGVTAEIALLKGFSSWYPGNEVGEAINAALPTEDMLLAGFFLLVTVCSCSYWTLVAGSILGGMVFTVVIEMTLGRA